VAGEADLLRSIHRLTLLIHTINVTKLVVLVLVLSHLHPVHQVQDKNNK
jgi:hypothetical protein